MSAEVFRKGLDLQHVVAGDLARDYHSDLVETIRLNDFTYQDGRVSVHLAKEFGFCYGVERAVDYAYQTRKKFPERTVYLTGEIIHNPLCSLIDSYLGDFCQWYKDIFAKLTILVLSCLFRSSLPSRIQDCLFISMPI